MVKAGKKAINPANYNNVFLISRFNGFTFIELMLAAAILASTVLVILHNLISITLFNETIRNYATAITHAQFVLEEIKDADFYIIKDENDNGFWNWNRTKIYAQGLAAMKNETITTSTSEVSGPALLNITVRVDWLERNGRVSNRKLTTFIAEP